MNYSSLKKWKWLILSSFLILFFIGCTKKEEQKLQVGVYQLENQKESTVDKLFYPKIQLKEEDEFVFTISPLSSYHSVGTYIQKDNKLICNTSDSLYHYVFLIEEDSLILSLQESSKVNTYGMFELEEGSRYSFIHKE